MNEEITITATNIDEIVKSIKKEIKESRMEENHSVTSWVGTPYGTVTLNQNGVFGSKKAIKWLRAELKKFLDKEKDE